MNAGFPPPPVAGNPAARRNAHSGENTFFKEALT